MSADHSVSRRGFIAGAVAATGGLTLLSKQGSALATATSDAAVAEAAASGLELASANTVAGAASVDMLASAEPRLFLFDAERAEQCHRIAGSAGLRCESRPITGDRVRFASDLFTPESAPAVIAGVSTYADFILLSGTAAEHGYRVLEESPQGALISWKLARLRRPTSSG